MICDKCFKSLVGETESNNKNETIVSFHKHEPKELYLGNYRPNFLLYAKMAKQLKNGKIKETIGTMRVICKFCPQCGDAITEDNSRINTIKNTKD